MKRDIISEITRAVLTHKVAIDRYPSAIYLGQEEKKLFDIYRLNTNKTKWPYKFMDINVYTVDCDNHLNTGF